MIAREGWTRIAIFALLAFGVQVFAGATVVVIATAGDTVFQGP